MVRSLVIAAAIVAFGLIPMSFALADIGTDNGPGCGLGKLAWADAQGKRKVVQQVLAATTNGTFGSQTFGISSGTSGCTNDGIVKNDQKVPVFASVNFENLKQEMAQGHGEFLASLATLLGVRADRKSEFFALMQERYTTLFKSAETTPSEMLTALNREITAHPALFEAGENR
jgi:Protein of unknown function (DUF3015)